MESLALPPSAAVTAARGPQRYRLIDTLGESPLATVHRVHDLELDEVVVLKVLGARVAADPRMVERLKREIRIARSVRHPNVARVYDLEEWEGRLCISMEYIEGQTLETRLAAAPLEWSAAVDLLSTVALALEAAHELGVVHRDLKPANIILDRKGNPYLLDFGIAIAPDGADSGPRDVIRGSPAYMAPERWRGVPGLPASDLYSLGVVAFEMLTGHTPFHASSLRVLMSQHLHAPMPSLSALVPGLPLGLVELIGRLLEKDAQKRPASASVALRALRGLRPRAVSGPWQPDSPPRGRVLVVEDDGGIRGMLAALLRKRGVTVDEAADGFAALEIAERLPPDVVFLDIAMPGLDGVETLRALKASPQTAGRPVVMLSGSVDPQHPALSRGLGAVAFLNKPINPDVLDLVLDKYLG